MAHPDADVAVVERSHGGVEVESGGGSRPDIVELRLADVAVVDLRDLESLIPVRRVTHEERVETSLEEKLEGFFRQPHDSVDEAIRIVAIAVELLVARPPILHPREGDAAAEFEVALEDDIGAGGGA